MTKRMLAVFALAAAIAMPAFAQSSSSQPMNQTNPAMTQSPDQNSTQEQRGASQPAQTQSAQPAGSDANGMNSQSGQTMSGTISTDGKQFSSNNTTYNISNPNSVKAYANQPITVGYEMDTNNSIRITKVMLTKPQQ